MKRRGFTLVELAIVIAILGILALYAIPKYQGMVEEARTAQAKAQLGTVRSALAIYYAKNSGKFPDTQTFKDGSFLFADGNIPTVEATLADGTVKKSNAVTPGNGDGVVSESEITDEGGWVYDVSDDRTKADVRINAKGTSAEGILWYKY
ncbi:type II secretion system protein [Caldisericum sp.]|uniref:type II secretion system protein n=1 Tax=Caldisericum sp. TaxID=2499687 RepID=UPI003D0ECA55